MLLKLKDIGKIYETNNLYTIGIRHVNLEFSLNEFVTIEGESGSGKSTLLNVIGATDTYEEGELYFNNDETSHYSLNEWDQYREQNIAMIFQDFNIIENLTVLENVEIALLRITNLKERKAKARELITKVGLLKQINQKASKLSGGEKQRTVIARALAKDAPIILADEPTGNLDIKSSQEIASLLKEVSKDKLIIVVTHNPEFFEKERTRQIIIKDGSVTSDNHLENNGDTNLEIIPKDYQETKSQRIKNTFWLGTINYKSRPKFTILMTFILIVFALALFFVLAIFSNQFISPLKNSIDNNPINGKLLITNKNKAINKNDYEQLIKELSPSYYFSNHKLVNFKIPLLKNNLPLRKDYQLNILYDPYHYHLNKDEALLEIAYAYSSDITTIKEVFMRAGLDIANIKVKITLSLTEPRLYLNKETIEYKGKLLQAMFSEIIIDKAQSYAYTYRINPDLKPGHINLINSKIWDAKDKYAILEIYQVKTFLIDNDSKTENTTDNLMIELSENDYNLIFNNEVIDYNPVFFYKNDREASSKLKALNSDYVGLLSTTTYYVNNAGEIFFNNTISYLLLILICFIIGMIISIIFSKNVKLFSTDFAIYRTLGIKRKTAKASLYIQMLLIFIPTIIILPLVSLVAVLIPGSNIKFISLYNYLFIELMMLLIVMVVAFRFNKSIILKSIRKSLARGQK